VKKKEKSREKLVPGVQGQTTNKYEASMPARWENGKKSSQKNQLIGNERRMRHHSKQRKETGLDLSFQ